MLSVAATSIGSYSLSGIVLMKTIPLWEAKRESGSMREQERAQQCDEHHEQGYE